MTLRVDDADARLIKDCARFENKTISDFIRDAVMDRIQEQEDIALLRKAIAEDDGVRYSHEEVLKELGL